MASAPRVGRDGCEYRGDSDLRKIRIFFQKGLDTHHKKQPGDLPVGLIAVQFDRAVSKTISPGSLMERAIQLLLPLRFH
jgi:hypothetical protein